MLIHNMTEAECRRALKRASVGRLACARDNQPYVVPIYLAYSEHHLYAFSTVGQKIEWMRSNPLVCVEIDEVTSTDSWLSVIVFGRYEELPNRAEYKNVRAQALELFQRRAFRWWEPASVYANNDEKHSHLPISFRIHIDRISGHHAMPDTVDQEVVQPTAAKRSWLRNIFDDP